ncbi:restriction endonuclease subunit S [Rheinheimera texasensis]|uniref:restriction endonuclease subunit S n=1 Tax=Rheinheimera texasensis TaxID=306205 RepID=UPI000A0721AF|nr:restriction endonuclease subunit S [Rheinheimera texasensis]
MRSNYKKLGQFIRIVDVRNKEDSKDHLLGVSTQKIFIDSVANTVGTDFRSYKIVKINQFTYVPDTSRRGDKIAIAMLQSHDKALVSQAYTVFEITDHEKLDPEYLMMWFRRPEFDRYARFKSHGSVREIFEWDEMCDIELPVPSIEIQREIVREYNVVNYRIILNKNITKVLELTAQSIFKQWFVDFEFPISKEHAFSMGQPELEGKPYKTSGGEMSFSKVLGIDIPSIWNVKRISEICEVINGRAYKDGEYRESGTKIIRIQNLSGGNKWIYSDMTLPENKYVSNGDLIFAWSATFGPFIWRQEKSIYHYHIWRMDCFNLDAKLFLYHHLRRVTGEVSEQGSGSIFSHITKGLMESQNLIYPDDKTLQLFNSIAGRIDKNIELNQLSDRLCKSLMGVIEGRMSRA